MEHPNKYNTLGNGEVEVWVWLASDNDYCHCGTLYKDDDDDWMFSDNGEVNYSSNTLADLTLKLIELEQNENK